MASATEYYGYLLSQGYGKEQIARFAHFADQANKGVISQNQAYRMAIEEGWSASDGGKTFKDWVNQANEQEWISKGLSVFGSLAESGAFRRRDRGDVYIPPPPPKRSNAGLYIIGGLAVIGIGVAIYYATKKK